MFWLAAGSIFEAHKRRMVQPLLYLRAASLTAETAFLSALPSSPLPAARRLRCSLHVAVS